MVEINSPPVSGAERALDTTPTAELVTQLFAQSKELVSKEVSLAKAEMRADLRDEVTMVLRFGVAAVAALATLNLLLVAGVFALSPLVPLWAAALLVAAVTLVVAALAAMLAWGKRVRRPLEKTEKTLKEDVQWVKERLT